MAICHLFGPVKTPKLARLFSQVDNRIHAAAHWNNIAHEKYRFTTKFNGFFNLRLGIVMLQPFLCLHLVFQLLISTCVSSFDIRGAYEVGLRKMFGLRGGREYRVVSAIYVDRSTPSPLHASIMER